MISNRPYLIRAMYQWMVDNEWTPHVQVDANYPYTKVPEAFVQDGVIILNINPEAVMGIDLQNDWISFRARFQGIEQEVGFSPNAVLAIFARENGEGMPFPAEPYPEDVVLTDQNSGLSTVEGGQSGSGDGKKPNRPDGKPTLSVVK